MLRPVDDVGHRPDLDDAAGVHHGDAVRGLGDHAHVVRDQHHRGAVLAAQPLQQLDDLRLDRDVERRGRLVGDRSACGSAASASAITTRWRMPPENWCG